MVVHGHPKTPKNTSFFGSPSPQGSHSPYILGDTTRPGHVTCVLVWCKSDRRRLRKTLHKQTDRQTNKQTDTTKIMVTWPWTNKGKYTPSLFTKWILRCYAVYKNVQNGGNSESQSCIPNFLTDNNFLTLCMHASINGAQLYSLSNLHIRYRSQMITAWSQCMLRIHVYTKVKSQACYASVNIPAAKPLLISVICITIKKTSATCNYDQT